jgi:hypothetical protein
VSYFTLRWLSKKCNFEPRASVSSVDEGQRPSHRPRCDRQYDRGCKRSRNNARINDLDGRTTKALNRVSMAFAICRPSASRLTAANIGPLYCRSGPRC